MDRMAPFLRRVQQSYSFHIVVAGLVAAGTTMFGCFNEASEFSAKCLTRGAIAGGIYLFAALQHSPNSASFRPDGTKDDLVDKIKELPR